jgi:hypothetical protein
MVMLVAILTVHWGHGFFTSRNGSELPLTYISGALLLMFAGLGPYAVDSLLGLTAWPANVTWISLGAAVVLALGNVLVRRPAPQQQQPAR